MRISKDPMEPLRCWKELFLGERALRTKGFGFHSAARREQRADGRQVARRR